MPSPTNSPCASPSLGLIPPEAMKNATLPFKEARAGKASARMTTAVCRRASRMARPSEPSLEAQRVAAAHVFADESVMREAGMERISYDDMQRFRLNAASTGKGPAVKADTGNPEKDAVAQAKINHMVSIKSRHVESNNQEPTWLMDMQNSCPQMYGRLAANAIKSNAVNSSVIKREKTQGAANQVCSHRTHSSPRFGPHVLRD